MTGYARYEVPFGSFDINEFRGYNATAAKANSEMRDMMNLSSEKYPYLSPRESRSNVEFPAGIGNISKIFRANGKLVFIADGKMWYDGKAVLQFSAGSKSVAVCNGKICVAPDLVYYDYLNDISGRMDRRVMIYVYPVLSGLGFGMSEGMMRLVHYYDSGIGGVEFPWEKYLSPGDSVRFIRAGKGIEHDVYGKAYYVDSVVSDSIYGSYVVLRDGDGNLIESDNKFERMSIVINNKDTLVFESIVNKVTNDTENEVYKYSFDLADGSGEDAMNAFGDISKAYLRFEKDDVVTIEDPEAEDSGEKIEYMITSVTESKRWTSISFASAVPEITKGILTISGTVPEMDHICERDNRLFGVCSKDNTVVASKLGQPLNFRYFSGTSVDSYSVEVGSDGEFTGIATYAGNVILFKERYIHMLTGTKPSMYRLEGIETYGCQKGSAGSICSLSGRLIYKSPGGIYMFDGGYPACISKVFGTERYYEAFAADDDRRYYVSMKDQKGIRRLYVYDTYSGFWHIEDSERAVSMCEVSGEVYIAYVDHVEKIGDGDGRVSWFAQFGPFDLQSANKKVISGVTLRYKLPQRSSLCIEVSVDGGEYEAEREVYYTADGVLECDIPLRRCSEFSLRLSGIGDIEVRGISFKLREGAGTR